MSKHALALLALVALVLLSFCGITPAVANPVGTDYGLELTLFRPIPASLPLALERHVNDQIPFDLTNKIGVLTHIAPNPDVDNDLNVMEMVAPGTDSETISIWIEGQELMSSGQHVRMFTETVPVDGDRVRFRIDDLYWLDFDGVSIIENIRFLATFPDPNPAQGIVPLDLQISGDGTASSPLTLQADFDAYDFDLDGAGMLDATDFHVEFTVTHTPEPSGGVLALVTIAGAAFGTRRRSRSRRRAT